LLGILALITLILLLWGGFQMVTAAGDDKKYGDGFTILKQAAFGLIMIGVAWFIVSLIFFVITLVTN
jgi:Type IV secretion system pilin